jgi:hypothetical protein
MGVSIPWSASEPSPHNILSLENAENARELLWSNTHELVTVLLSGSLLNQFWTQIGGSDISTGPAQIL